MQIKVQSGDIASVQADAIVLGLFEGVTAPDGNAGAVDQAMGGALGQLIASGDLRGKQGEMTLLHTLGRLPASRVVVVGLGKQDAFDIDKVRSLSGDLARFLRRNRVKNVAIADAAGLGVEDSAAAIAEGMLLGTYRFMRHKKADDEADVESLTIVEPDASKIGALERGVERGRIMAEQTNFSRDLANEPANYLTPTELADRAQKMAAETGLECEIYGPDWLKQKGMGGVLGVASGSAQEPRFIVLRYKGAGDEKPVALVGKGITFDTGGISIKPAAGMWEMKGDMSGGASVISAMGAIGRLKPAINVVGIVPATENMPSGTAVKPGDVLVTMIGKTIEVDNTDAEGRLILSDGLAYAVEQGATAIVDVATLTGAISIALGNVAMGAMGNDAGLMERIKRAAAAAGEKVWELPMWEEYREQIHSDVADIKNTGGRGAGSITAAMLLREFVNDVPWVHLDIAGVDIYERDKGVIVKGSSGIPVRTLVQLVLQTAEGGVGVK